MTTLPTIDLAAPAVERQATNPAPECKHCRLPLDQQGMVVSSHRTSEGVLSYVRCLCGRLTLRLTPHLTD